MNRKIKSEYEQDVYAWAMHTAKLLREKKINEIDFEHVAEEIESMGSSERRELIHRLAILIMHLLKWQYQPMKRGKSWMNTVKIQRIDLLDLLEESPSLRRALEQKLESVYERAVLDAANETGLDEKRFPIHCPYALEQILSHDFLPE